MIKAMQQTALIIVYACDSVNPGLVDYLLQRRKTLYRNFLYAIQGPTANKEMSTFCKGTPGSSQVQNWKTSLSAVEQTVSYCR